MKMYIYRLRDPRTREVRYVGSSYDLEKRLRNHINNPHSVGLREWIDELQQESFAPELEILEEVDGTDWREREAVYIAEHLNFREPLLNLVPPNTPLPHPLIGILGMMLDLEDIENCKLRLWLYTLDNPGEITRQALMRTMAATLSLEEDERLTQLALWRREARRKSQPQAQKPKQKRKRCSARPTD